MSAALRAEHGAALILSLPLFFVVLPYLVFSCQAVFRPSMLLACRASSQAASPAQGGYNWQIGALVAGLEVDFEYFGLRGSSSGGAVYPCCAPASIFITSSTKTDWLFTARPRIGYANNNWLFYATGGLAVTDLHGNFTFTDNVGPGHTESGSVSSTKVGYAVGGGIEAGLWSRWTVKAEYLFVDFGRVSTTSNNLIDALAFAFPAQIFTHSLDLKASIVRLGLNYHF
jgi:outer membrane immunogenic protein